MKSHFSWTLFLLGFSYWLSNLHIFYIHVIAITISIIESFLFSGQTNFNKFLSYLSFFLLSTYWGQIRKVLLLYTNCNNLPLIPRFKRGISSKFRRCDIPHCHHLTWQLSPTKVSIYLRKKNIYTSKILKKKLCKSLSF